LGRINKESYTLQMGGYGERVEHFGDRIRREAVALKIDPIPD
jgi:hypothetical protein